MNFGFVLFDYFPFGGLQRDCLKIAQCCVQRGHKVTILTRTWQGENAAGLPLELLGRKGLSNVSRNRHFLRQLAALLPTRDFDAVIGFNKLPGLDVYYGADPCFAAKIRNRAAWRRGLPRTRHFLDLERAVFAQGARTTILQITPRDIPIYQGVYGTEPERFHVLPPNAARRAFTEAERQQTRRRLRQENGWPADDLLVLFVGSDFQRKGLDRAIHGLASLAEAMPAKIRLVILGQARPGAFARLARRLNVAGRVHFLGGRTDAPDWMLAADVLVHPARSENTGTVLVESLASGLPVLCSAVCGYACHIDRAEAGVVLPEPFDQNRFSQALRRALEATSELARWRANAMACAATEDLYGCHDRAAEIIETTIQRRIEAKDS